MKVLILLALAAYTQAIAPGVCEVDLIFVVDVSGSIGGNQFQVIQDFMSDITAQLNVEDDLARVGSVKFGSVAYPGFDLWDYIGDPDGLQVDGIDLLTFNGGGTNIPAGIRAMTNMFNDHGRPGVPWVGIVLTDGYTHWPIPQAQDRVDLAQLTTHMVAIGVGAGWGNNVYTPRLEDVASDSDSVLMVDNLDGLKYIIQELAGIICQPSSTYYVCEAHSCTPYGPMVKTFDGLYAPIMAEQKTTLFRGSDETLGELDPCKTQIRCVTTQETWWNREYQTLHLDWCGVALSVHQSPDKSHRNWVVGQTLLHIGERGQGLAGDTLLNFSDYVDDTIPYPDLDPEPFRDPECDPQQKAKVVGNSITITSPCCNWCVVWTPRVGCTSIQIIMDGSWAGQTEGMCGDSDGNLLNDWGSCDCDCFLGDYRCLSDSCKGGDHDGQGFIGGTRIHENTIDGLAPPDACY